VSKSEPGTVRRHALLQLLSISDTRQRMPFTQRPRAHLCGAAAAAILTSVWFAHLGLFLNLAAGGVAAYATSLVGRRLFDKRDGL
jgi:hypothetical protein